LADCELTPAGDELWACNSSFGAPGLRVFSTATQLPIGGPITCTLPPQGITFDAATGQVAGVNEPHAPGLGLAPPSPNPARESVRLAVSSPSAGTLEVAIVDLAGRRVRALTREVAAGAAELAWDLRDESGRRVAPGLYFACVRSGAERAARPLLVVR